MNEKEIKYRRQVIDYYKRVAAEAAPEKTRGAFAALAQRMENDLAAIISA